MKNIDDHVKWLDEQLEKPINEHTDEGRALYTEAIINAISGLPEDKRDNYITAFKRQGYNIPRE